LLLVPAEPPDRIDGPKDTPAVVMPAPGASASPASAPALPVLTDPV